MGKLAIFICGLLLGAIGAFGAVVYQEMYKPPEKDNIVFSSKDFYDNKDYWVSISGTLTGEDMAYNNTYGVLCHKEQNTCFISYVEQIGSNPPQTGKIEQYTIPIVKWTNYEVIAQEDSPFACIRMTITIDRGRKALLWLEEPINQTKPNCKDARTTIRKLSIEDPPKRKAMKQSP